MDTTSWAFHAGPRTPKDQGWFIGYLLALLGVVTVGFTAWGTGNDAYPATFHSGSMSDPRMCEASNAGRRLLDADDDLDIDHLGHVALKGILASAVLATIAALALIQLFRKAPQTMVVIGCALPVRSHLVYYFLCLDRTFLSGLHTSALVLPLTSVLVFYNRTIAFLVTVAVMGGSLVAIVSCLIPVMLLAFVYSWAQQRMKLVGRMMKVAADALAANTQLAPFAVATNVVQLVPLLGFGATLYVLQSNGDLVSNPDISPTYAAIFGDESSRCVDTSGDAVSCCVWQTHAWVPPMQVAVALVLMWTLAIVGQIRVYVLGGVITQWYFDESASGKVMLSVGHALGPARGTLCFSGAIVTVCDLLRHLANRIRNSGRGIVGMILKALLATLIDYLQEIIRFLSTMATIQAAATGDAFLASARTVGELLVRNGMKSVTVWWLPQFVLQWTVLGAAGLLGAVTYGVSFGLGNGSSRHSPGADAFALSVTVGFSFLVLMGWVASFLTTATEVVYLCYVRDLDNRAVTRSAVHDVLKEMPAASGAVVLQPDDNVMYGALEEGEGSTPLATPLAGASGSAPRRDLTAAIEAAPQAPQSLDPKGRM